MIPFRRRLEIVLFAWVVTALLLLAMGTSTGLAVGLTAVLFGIAFVAGELIP